MSTLPQQEAPGNKKRHVYGTILAVLALLSFALAFCLASYAGNKALEFMENCTNDAQGAGVQQCITTAFYKERIQHPYLLSLKPITAVTNAYNEISLRTPLVLNIVTFLLLVACAGCGLKGDVFGLLLDSNTNCMSLSRTQAVLWTAVILGGYSTLAFFNIAFGARYAMMATPVIDLFPDIDNDVLLLLGIVAGSPIVATYISNTATATGCAPVGPVSPWQRFQELLTDDAPGGPGDSQLSRMQCLFITVILLICYFRYLLQLVRVVDASVLLGAYGKTPCFTILPVVDGSFMILLAASHTIFQVAKSNWGKKTFGTPQQPPHSP
jgi:hypothetical protein